LIRVVNPAQIPAFPAEQGGSALASALRDAVKFSNISIIWIEGGGGGCARVDLGIPAIDCNFDILPIRESNMRMDLYIVGGPGGDDTHIFHPNPILGNEFCRLAPELAINESNVPTPNNSINCKSNIQTHPNLAVGVVVYNVNKDTWSIINAFTGPKTANTTMVSPVGGPGHAGNDVFIFYNAITNCTAGFVGQPEVPIVGYDYSNPFVIEVASLGSTSVGEDLHICGPDVGFPHDLAHLPMPVITFPSIINRSKPCKKLHIRCLSDYRLNYILRWRT